MGHNVLMPCDFSLQQGNFASNNRGHIFFAVPENGLIYPQYHGTQCFAARRAIPHYTSNNMGHCCLHISPADRLYPQYHGTYNTAAIRGSARFTPNTVGHTLYVCVRFTSNNTGHTSARTDRSMHCIPRFSGFSLISADNSADTTPSGRWDHRFSRLQQQRTFVGIRYFRTCNISVHILQYPDTHLQYRRTMPPITADIYTVKILRFFLCFQRFFHFRYLL